ncbi:MAG: tRNA pseudouridine(55) synthase TruB [Tenericutes bacterium]|nr:MAG: tRNA pseudouridine(55) synthase TruB [Mycoplasmatota bacterium]
MPLFIINKPKDISSNNYLTQIKREIGTKKAGHSGTLDPFATGLLVIATDGETKLLSRFLETTKVYTGKILFGKTTDTLDTEGEVTEEKDVEITKLMIEEQIQLKFTGIIEQTPPIYSAIKVDGKRSYDLAREGKEVEHKPVKRTIFSFKVKETSEKNVFSFEVKVSSGTYIRSLAYDLGQALNVPSMLIELTRTKVGLLSLENVVGEYTEVSILDALNLQTIDVREDTMK